MKLHKFAWPCLLFLASSVAFAGTGQNTFVLIGLSGRTLGKADYSISKTRNGFAVRSYYAYRATRSDMPSTVAPGASSDGGPGSTEAQMHLEYKVAANGDLLDGYMENQTNGLMTSFSTNRQHAIEVSSVQAGVHGLVNTVPMPGPDFFLLPIYDPSALQILLSSAQSQPRPDGDYLLAIPSRDGARPLAVHLQPGTDASGSLGGQPCPLRQYVLQFGTAKPGAAAPQAQLYVSSDGQLMEADLTMFGVKYVRTNFILQPR